MLKHFLIIILIFAFLFTACTSPAPEVEGGQDLVEGVLEVIEEQIIDETILVEQAIAKEDPVVEQALVKEDPVVEPAVKEEVVIQEPIKGKEITKFTSDLSWYWQLEDDLNLDFDADVYDIDLFNTPGESIDFLHDRNIKVVCYFSAGSWEEFRDDASLFPREVLGNELDGWPDERWLDISNFELFENVMLARLDLAAEKACDAVEPDNVDAFDNDAGFDLTYDDQLRFNQWLAGEAHNRGLAIALKNDLDQITDLVDFFDFSVNEQCFEFAECDLLSPFIAQNKAVFGVEYELESVDFCDSANDLGFSWASADYDLNGNFNLC